ncbi:hypothetical protein StoSoilB3_11850 [Arthrobacter sp. StoSoilB3]|nr:hypothetical protein StoSoilB3_11850 [Arthrobacter sp. StoSoilB3]
MAPTLIMVSCSTPKLRTSGVPPSPLPDSLTICPMGLRRSNWAPRLGLAAPTAAGFSVFTGTVTLDVPSK